MSIDKNAMNKLSYGLFVLSAKLNGKDNGCIINTAIQVANEPNTIAVSVNKQNYTHDIIMETGEFNISVLTEDCPFKVFEHFGFQSGRNVDKFSGCETRNEAENKIVYIPKYTNAYLSCKVISKTDLGSHTLFVAELTESKVLSDRPSLTYDYYYRNIKPKPQAVKESTAKVWVCSVCGFTYDEAVEKVPFEELPDDWTCPLCKHPKSDFELME